MTCVPCCDEPNDHCPTNQWITLHHWTGAYAVANDLKKVHVAPFRLRFNHGTDETTIYPLQITATLADLKAALEALPNIGASITIVTDQGQTSGKLIDSVTHIYFDSLATSGTDVPLLEVIGSGWEIEIVREGDVGVDEIQSLKRKKGVWELMGLDRYEDSVWQWRVVVLGTGVIPDLTKLCLQQNRRDWSEWTAPLSEQNYSKFYKIEFGNLKWFPTSPGVASVLSGTFTITVTVGTDSQTTSPIAYNASTADVLAAIQSLTNLTNVGNITITGGPLTTSHISVKFELGIEAAVLTGASIDLLGTQPYLVISTIQDGNDDINEQQLIEYSWPANSGTFTLSVLGGTTTPINWNASAADVRNAFAFLNTIQPLTVNTLQTGSTTYSPDPPYTIIVNEVQQVRLPINVNPVSGTFQITYNNGVTSCTTAILSVPINTAAITNALRSLPNVLASDNFIVTNTSNVGAYPFSFNIEFTGTLSGRNVAPLTAASSIVASNVVVTSSIAPIPRYWITFVGDLSLTNIPTMTGTSNLVNRPSVVLTDLNPSNYQDFRNAFEPLNVGTIWKHYIRKAYGHAENRAIRIDPRYPTSTLLTRSYTGGMEPDIVFGPYERQEIPCGTITTNGLGTTCIQREWAIEYQTELSFYDPTYGWLESGIPVKNSAWQLGKWIAEFNENSGRVNVVGPEYSPGIIPLLEFGFQIRCLGCNYSSEFNLWGMYEQSDNGYWSPADEHAAELYDPFPGTNACIIRISDGLPNASEEFPECRHWFFRYDNVPHQLRANLGPDGFDGHLIADKFVVEGQLAFRKPLCTSPVVLLGDGYWLEQHRSKRHVDLEQGPRGCVPTCYPPKPKRERHIEHPTSDIDRLKIIYGNQFSYWGGWIDMDYSTTYQNKIRCRFDEYDLSNVKVLILGGLPADAQFDDPHVVYPGDGYAYLPSRSMLDMKPWDAYRFLIFGEEGAYGVPTEGLVHKEFETGTLDILKAWLSQGGKTLLLDGGIWPIKFLSALGCTTTMEVHADCTLNGSYTISPNTLNGSLNNGIDNIGNQTFQMSNGNGLPVWITNYEFPLENDVPITRPYVEVQYTPGTRNHHPFLAGVSAGGTFIPISDKFRFTNPDDSFWGYGMLTAEYFVCPYGFAMHSVTTIIAKVTPGIDTVVLGQVKGEILEPPWVNANQTQHITTPIDYPGIIIEHWKSLFRLRFNGEYTVPIPFTATAAEVQTALEALSTIGPGLVVTGGPLPSNVDVIFQSPLTQGIDVPLIEVCDTNYIAASVDTEGGSGIDEVQRLQRGVHGGPSRIIISNVSELVNPDDWGTNYYGLERYHGYAGSHQRGDNDAIYFFVGPPPGFECQIHVFPDYGKDGYGYGHGLTHIVNDQFLKNLLDRWDEY